MHLGLLISKLFSKKKNKIPSTKKKKVITKQTPCTDIFDDSYLKSIINMSYEQLVEFLLNKYGPVPGDYILITKTNNYRINPDIKRTQDGLVIHHIREDCISDLSHERAWGSFFEFQKAEELVYANPLEHVILHYLINFEHPNTLLGLGGLFNYNMLKSLSSMSGIISNHDYSILVTRVFALPNAERYRESFNRSVEESYPSSLLEHHDERVNITKWLNQHCKEAITEISRIDFDRLFHTKFADKYEHFYIMRSSNNHFLCYSKNRQNKIILWKGGSRKALSLSETELYAYIDKMYDAYELYIAELNKILQPISRYIVTNLGGSGRIHGLVVDIDFETHVKVDLYNKDIVTYYAPVVDPTHRYCLPNLLSYTPQNKSCIEYRGINREQVRTLLGGKSQQELTLCTQGFTGIVTTSKTVGTVSTEGFLPKQFEIVNIQKTLEYNLFYEWSEDIFNQLPFIDTNSQLESNKLITI